MSEKILVTGGAGYVGSHVAKKLLQEGFEVVILDNLDNGHIEAVEILRKDYPEKLEFVKADIGAADFPGDIFKTRQIEAVIHLAAKINVDESILKPDLYHQVNYLGGINLLEAMATAGIDKFIFISSAAVYGDPAYLPIDENHRTSPSSPYGQSKIDFEKYLLKTKNIRWAVLRLFNVAGSDAEGKLGKCHIGGSDLIENVMRVVLDQKDKLIIYGSNYQTDDGTAMRDFVHVDDVSSAVLATLKNLDRSRGETINIGSGKGHTISAVIAQAEEITGKNISHEFQENRPGDIGISISDPAYAQKILGWEPAHSDLKTLIQTDWSWRKDHPQGY